ncbi:MAG: hypothetical protein ACI9FG_000264 [Crocinitomicaceae bacterium]|jgi:hypothetical protein
MAPSQEPKIRAQKSPACGVHQQGGVRELYKLTQPRMMHARYVVYELVE